MRLDEWLDDNGITRSAFGKLIGKDKSTVSRICSGKVSMDRETVAAIFRATKGVVTPNDLYEVESEKRAS